MSKDIIQTHQWPGLLTYKPNMAAYAYLKEHGYKIYGEYFKIPAGTTKNGQPFYIGSKAVPGGGIEVGVVAFIPPASEIALFDNSQFVLSKEDMKEMSAAALEMRPKKVTLFTNFGMELHSKVDNSKSVGFDEIIKVIRPLDSFKAGGQFLAPGDKVIKITPYQYHGWHYPKQIVWVDSSNKSPDPSGLMIWGYGEKNDPVSDFKGFFEKAGKPVEMHYSPKRYESHGQEVSRKIQMIRDYIYAKDEKMASGGAVKKVRIPKEERVTIMLAVNLLSNYSKSFNEYQVGYTQTQKLIQDLSQNPKSVNDLIQAIISLQHYNEEKTNQDQRKHVNDIIDQLKAMNEKYKDENYMGNTFDRVVIEHTGTGDNKIYHLTNAETYDKINMFFDSFYSANKYADKNGLRVVGNFQNSREGKNMAKSGKAGTDPLIIGYKAGGSTAMGPYRADIAGIGEYRWSSNGIEYETTEAAQKALDSLSDRWFGFDLSRVVPSTTPMHEPVDTENNTLYQNFRKKMQTGGKIDTYKQKTGTNINIYGYNTINFDMCSGMAPAFENAIEKIDLDKEDDNVFYKSMQGYLKSLAIAIDEILHLEKIAANEGYELNDTDINFVMQNLNQAAVFNYKCGNHINVSELVGPHITNITNLKNNPVVQEPDEIEWFPENDMFKAGGDLDGILYNITYETVYKDGTVGEIAYKGAAFGDNEQAVREAYKTKHPYRNILTIGPAYKKGGTIEDDTVLLPGIIADSVANNFIRNRFSNPTPEQMKNAPGQMAELSKHLEKKANDLYKTSAFFRKKINQVGGNKGRDALYAFMNHWAQAYGKKNFEAGGGLDMILGDASMTNGGTGDFRFDIQSPLFKADGIAAGQSVSLEQYLNGIKLPRITDLGISKQEADYVSAKKVIQSNPELEAAWKECIVKSVDGFLSRSFNTMDTIAYVKKNIASKPALWAQLKKDRRLEIDPSNMADNIVDWLSKLLVSGIYGEFSIDNSSWNKYLPQSLKDEIREVSIARGKAKFAGMMNNYGYHEMGGSLDAILGNASMTNGGPMDFRFDILNPAFAKGGKTGNKKFRGYVILPANEYGQKGEGTSGPFKPTKFYIVWAGNSYDLYHYEPRLQDMFIVFDDDAYFEKAIDAVRYKHRHSLPADKKFYKEFLPESEVYKYESGGSVKDTGVAETIRDQIGHKAFYMLGAYNLVKDTKKNWLSFRIRGSRKANYIKITLMPDDTYTMEFGIIRKPKIGLNLTQEEYMKKMYKVVNTVDMVHAEDLHRVIENNTDLYTRLFEGGGRVDLGNDGLLHALLEFISAGTIAGMTGLNQYTQIDGIRSTAIQMLLRDGDQPYNLDNLKKLLNEAKDEWAENNAELNFQKSSYAGGGHLSAAAKNTVKPEWAKMNLFFKMTDNNVPPGIQSLITHMIDNKVYRKTVTISNPDKEALFLKDAQPAIDAKLLSVKPDEKANSYHITLTNSTLHMIKFRKGGIVQYKDIEQAERNSDHLRVKYEELKEQCSISINQAWLEWQKGKNDTQNEFNTELDKLIQANFNNLSARDLNGSSAYWYSKRPDGLPGISEVIILSPHYYGYGALRKPGGPPAQRPSIILFGGKGPGQRKDILLKETDTPADVIKAILKHKDHIVKFTGKEILKIADKKAKFKSGGDVDVIDYKDETIIHVPNGNDDGSDAFIINEEFFPTLELAKEYIDKGVEMSPAMIGAYRRGLFKKGGRVTSDNDIIHIYKQRNKLKAEILNKLSVPYGTAYGNVQINIDDVFNETGPDNLKYKFVGYGGIQFMGNINGKTKGDIYYKNPAIKKEIEGAAIALDNLEDDINSAIETVEKDKGKPITQHALLSARARGFESGGEVISISEMKQRILEFTKEFPLDAKTWDQAPGELFALHERMTNVHNEFRDKNLYKFDFEKRAKTPAESNKRHRHGIEKLLSIMKDTDIQFIYEDYIDWFWQFDKEQSFSAGGQTKEPQWVESEKYPGQYTDGPDDGMKAMYNVDEITLIALGYYIINEFRANRRTRHEVEQYQKDMKYPTKLTHNDNEFGGGWRIWKKRETMESGGPVIDEKYILDNHFGANVFAFDITPFEIKRRSISDDAEAKKFIDELKSQGFRVKKKSYSEFTAIMGVRRKDKQEKQ